MDYKDYNGTIEYSEEDKCFFGKVIGIRSLISYEGDTVEKLRKNFEEAVDTYLKDCKKDGVEPEQPINGNDEYDNLEVKQRLVEEDERNK